jgi:hypothetical protein
MSQRGRQRETVSVSRDLPRQRGGKPPRRARGAQRETVVVTPRIPARLRGVMTAGAATSVWNLLIVVLPVLAVVILAWWGAGFPGSVAAAVRMAGAIWLLAHGVPVGVAGLTVGLPPLLLSAVVVWRLSRAGAHTVRAIGGRDFPAVRAATLSVTLSYTVMTTVVAYLVSDDPFGVTIWRAAVHAAVLSLVAGSLGALAESGGGTALWHRIPVWLRRGMRSGALTMVVVLAAGALLAGVAIAVRGGSVAKTFAAFGGGAVGAVGVGVVCLLYLPTVAIWATAYLLGPGFAVGVDTHVSVIGVDIGPLPAFPLFAAIPDAPLDWRGTALWGVPLAVGCVFGVVLAIRSIDLALPQLTYASIVSGVSAGLVTAALSFAAAGPMGVGRMAELGPPVWKTAATAAGVVAAAVCLGALVARLVGVRRVE